MINGNECLFIDWLAICTSFFFFEKCLFRLLAHFITRLCVKTEERHRRTEGDSSPSAQALFRKENLWGVSSKTARVHCWAQTWGGYRGSWWKSSRRVTGWENVAVVTKGCCCWATKEDKLCLGHSSAHWFLVPTWRQRLTPVPLSVFGVRWGVSRKPQGVWS
jgi:hypothetical protein